jgi:transposase-like protein
MKLYAALVGQVGCMPDWSSFGYTSKKDAIESMASIWDVSESTMRRWVNGYTPERLRFTTFDIIEEEVHIELEALPEHDTIRGNAIFSGDADIDKKVEDSIAEALEYNEWAWCCAKVTASALEEECSTYLGHCSYRSEEDFIKSGYYEDMVAEATEELIETLANACY